MNLLKVCKQLAWGSRCTVAQPLAPIREELRREPHPALGLHVSRRPLRVSGARLEVIRDNRGSVLFCTLHHRAQGYHEASKVPQVQN